MKYYSNIKIYYIIKLINSKVTFAEQYNQNGWSISFYKNGVIHNQNNCSVIICETNKNELYKEYVLFGKNYGNHSTFSSAKEWRRYCKLLAFL